VSDFRERVSSFIGYAFVFLLIAVLIYGVWSVGRSANYHISYKDHVQETIRDMVKKECLK